MIKFEAAKIIHNHLHKLLPPTFDNYFNKVVNTINALGLLKLQLI